MGIMRGDLSLGYLATGRWSAWGLAALYVAYAAACVASAPNFSPAGDPYWATAEVLTIVGAPVQVLLLSAIHRHAPERAKVYSLVAFGSMATMAALTMVVHFTELVVARRMDLSSNPALAGVFDLGRPSLLFGADIAAWHIFFGWSLLFAAPAFARRGIETAVRAGLAIGGTLDLLGLIGPVTGRENLRLIGVVGYGLVFPVVCVMIGIAFRRAERGSANQHGAEAGEVGDEARAERHSPTRAVHPGVN
jgi:hypothetical protein